MFYRRYPVEDNDGEFDMMVEDFFVHKVQEAELNLTDSLLKGNIDVLPDGSYDKNKHMRELQAISRQFKEAGVNLVFTHDPNKSDLKNASSLTNINGVATWDIHIDENFSNYQKDKEKYLYKIRSDTANIL